MMGDLHKISRLGWLEAHASHDDPGCLIYPFSRNSQGYGAALRFGDKLVSAHRVMCTLAHGPAPLPHLEVAHNCGNGANGCVHPKHLRWSEPYVNQRDQHLHGRRVSVPSYIAQEIKLEIADLDVGYAELAERYSVSVDFIRNLATNRTWRWVEPGITVTPKAKHHVARRQRAKREEERRDTLSKEFGISQSLMTGLRITRK